MTHPRRNCPRDGHRLIEEALDPLGRHVVVDACARCHGMFLDHGEVMAWTGDRELQRVLTKHPLEPGELALQCPGCNARMVARDADDVRLDVCLACRGMWLDAGELEHLEQVDPATLKAGDAGQKAWAKQHGTWLGRLVSLVKA